MIEDERRHALSECVPATPAAGGSSICPAVRQLRPRGRSFSEASPWNPDRFDGEGRRIEARPSALG